MNVTHDTQGTRVARLLAAVLLVSGTVAGCHSDDVVGVHTFTECAAEPGCQTELAPIAPNVIPALEDVTSRVTAVLSPAARTAIAPPIARLEAALVARDIPRGRLALDAVLDAVAAAERADPASRPDLGVIRLGLAPAARSLGLPFSLVEGPATWDVVR